MGVVESGAQSVMTASAATTFGGAQSVSRGGAATTLGTSLLLRGGTVIDGAGTPRYAADVRIDGDRIAAIGPRLPAADATVIDATGLIVAPGFIDVHTHDDQIVLAQPAMLPKISQ